MILITGTGRSGTSFLMNLLTELGLNTGFTKPKQVWMDRGNSGMEKHIKPNPGTWGDLPYILKDPKMCDQIGALYDMGLQIDHVIVPMRKLEEVAASRDKRGVLWFEDRPSQKLREEEGWEKFFLRMLGRLFYDLSMCEIPYTTLIYPRLTGDAEYCYNKLYFLFPDLEFGEFEEKFIKISAMTAP